MFFYKACFSQLFQFRRMIDHMKRQFSNSSTNSAPGGIHIRLGGDSDSEDDDAEVSEWMHCYHYSVYGLAECVGKISDQIKVITVV